MEKNGWNQETISSMDWGKSYRFINKQKKLTTKTLIKLLHRWLALESKNHGKHLNYPCCKSIENDETNYDHFLLRPSMNQ